MFFYAHIYISDTGDLPGRFRKGLTFPTDVELETIHSLPFFENSLLVFSDWQKFAGGKSSEHFPGAFQS